MISVADIAAEITASGRTRQDVFSFLIRFFEVNGIQPTIDEIGDAISIIQGKPRRTNSKQIQEQLVRLARDGIIEREHGNRIIIPHSSWKFHGYRKIRGGRRYWGKKAKS